MLNYKQDFDQFHDTAVSEHDFAASTPAFQY